MPLSENNESSSMKALAVIFYVFAVVDFAGMFLGYDITGVFWSPIVAVGAGGILMKLARMHENEVVAEDQNNVQDQPSTIESGGHSEILTPQSEMATSTVKTEKVVSNPAPLCLESFLRSNDFGEYVPLFEANHIDFEMFVGLSDDDLKEIGIQSLGHRRILLKFAQEFEISASINSNSSEPSPPPDEMMAIPVSPNAKPTVAPVVKGVAKFGLGMLAGHLLGEALGEGDDEVEVFGFDTDGDGVIDTVGADMDGDGMLDSFAMDTDGDGYVDSAALDTNGDGYIDTVGVDSTGDGRIDTVAADLDGDQDIDIIAMDTDGNGEVDRIG